MFYCVEGKNIIFSNDFYKLVERFKNKNLTLDKNSISDYLEDAWNNIIKYDRTPFKEIRRLDVWNYMTDEFKIFSWKDLDTNYKFNENNLKDFKREFFNCVDFYLNKIHDKYNKISFSVSSGLDSNTLAARYVQLFPDDDVMFYTSRIDDVTDEYKIAISMEKVLHKNIIPIDLKPNTMNFLELLQDHINKEVPPRYFGVVDEGVMYAHLIKNILNVPTVHGMGADGRFGEFGGEYARLMNEFIRTLHFVKAWRVYKAISRSFSNDKYPSLFKFAKMLIKIPLRKIKRAILSSKNKNENKNKNELLKFKLPQSESSKIKTHKDAINYASQSGEVRESSIKFSRYGIKVSFPYAGYKFYKLSANCDPFIFSDGLNKSCERYAVKDLLPDEILNNYKKSGNPHMTLKKILSSSGNLKNVLDYIKSHSSSKIINSEQLIKNLESENYSNREFCALCLLIFEDKIINQMGINLSV